MKLIDKIYFKCFIFNNYRIKDFSHLRNGYKYFEINKKSMQGRH